MSTALEILDMKSKTLLEGFHTYENRVQKTAVNNFIASFPYEGKSTLDREAEILGFVNGDEFSRGWGTKYDFNDFFKLVDAVSNAGSGKVATIIDEYYKRVNMFSPLATALRPVHTNESAQNTPDNNFNSAVQYNKNSSGLLYDDSVSPSRMNHLRAGNNDTTNTKNNYEISRNQRGIGIGAHGKNTIQLFNSNTAYGEGSSADGLRSGNILKSYQDFSREVDGILGNISFQQTKINTQLGMWVDKAKYALRQGTKIGLGRDRTNTYNLPGSAHAAEGAAGRSEPNRFMHGRDYTRRFFQVVSNPAEAPNEGEITTAAQLGFNVGQIQGGENFGSADDDSIDSLKQYAKNFLGSIFKNKSKAEIGRELENLKLRLVRSYRPGMNRISQPFSVRAPLKDILNQNLLQPKNETHNGISNVETTEEVYDALYVNNRVRMPSVSQQDYAAAMNANERFNKGVISGVGIADLERQAEAIKSGPKNIPKKVFTFEDDDKKYLTNDQKHRGFTNNIAGTVNGAGAGEGSLAPAVENIRLPSESVSNRIGYMTGLTDEQFFPFLFVTENKKTASNNVFEQACYLQATINSMNESFSPSWQPKHFFGRTEQIHTYTLTDRSINISFIAYADDMRRLQNLYERINWLAQQTYGQYQKSDSGVNRLEAGPLLRLSIGDLYRGVPGFIQSLSYDWNHLGAGGKWEMTRDLRIPMSCSISLTFTVKHDDNPNRDYNFYSGVTSGVLRKAGERLIPGNNDLGTGQDPTGTVSETYVDLMDRNTSI